MLTFVKTEDFFSTLDIMFQAIWRVNRLGWIHWHLRQILLQERQIENFDSSHCFTIEFRMISVKRFSIATASEFREMMRGR
jgi:hypothetical protein